MADQIKFEKILFKFAMVQGAFYVKEFIQANMSELAEVLNFNSIDGVKETVSALNKTVKRYAGCAKMGATFFDVRAFYLAEDIEINKYLATSPAISEDLRADFENRANMQAVNLFNIIKYQSEGKRTRARAKTE